MEQQGNDPSQLSHANRHDDQAPAELLHQPVTHEQQQEPYPSRETSQNKQKQAVFESVVD